MKKVNPQKVSELLFPRLLPVLLPLLVVYLFLLSGKI